MAELTLPDSSARSFLPTGPSPTCGTQKGLDVADKSLLLAYE